MENKHPPDYELLTTAPVPDEMADASDQNPAPEQNIAVITNAGNGSNENGLHSTLGRLTVTSPGRYSVILGVVSDWAREFSLRFSNLGNKVDRLQLEVVQLSEKLADARVENATLKGEDAERVKHRPLVYFAIAVGPILFYNGLEQLSASHYSSGIVSIIIGAILVVLGLMTGRREEKQ